MRAFTIMASFAIPAITLAAQTNVRAGTLPNISGTWYAQGNRLSHCHISQSGTSVSLTNEQGRTASGRFADPSTLDTDWGYIGGRLKGSISSDLRRIDWSNGTYWSRPSVEPITPVETATPKPTPTPEPLRVNVMPIQHNNRSAIYVYAASLRNGYQPFTYRQCVSFRNVTTKVVSDVDFSFVVTDRTGGVEADYGWADKGTFTPPVNIDDHCFSGRLWSSHVVRRMTSQNIRVTQVTFADGTFWKPGMEFLRGYATSGEPLARPTVETQPSTESSGAPPSNVSVKRLNAPASSAPAPGGNET